MTELPESFKEEMKTILKNDYPLYEKCFGEDAFRGAEGISSESLTGQNSSLTVFRVI